MLMSVYCFFYGLCSLVMGLAVILRGRSSSQLALGHQFYWLGAFGLSSATYAWAHMFHIMPSGEVIPGLEATYLFVLPLAGVLLVRFGVGLLVEAGPMPDWLHFAPVMLLIPGALVIAYSTVMLVNAFTPEAIALWTRFLLLLPGSVLAGIGFVFQWRRLEQTRHSRQHHIVLVAGIAFFIHAFTTGVSQDDQGLIVNMPVEFWRTSSSVLVTASVIGTMGVFELEREQQIEKLEAERREARQMALTIYTRTRQETEVWMDSLVRLGRQIANMEDVDTVLGELVTMVRDVTKADEAILAVFEGEQRLVPKYMASGRITELPTSLLSDPHILHATIAGEPLRLPEDMPDVMLRWTVGSSLFAAGKAAIVPLRLNQTSIGVLCAVRDEGESFNCSALIGMGYLADQAVIALENAMMTGRLQSLAITEERARIAREMHDGLAQLLGYLGLQNQTLEALVQQHDTDAVLQELWQARAMIKSAQADVRENILSLRTTLAGDATLHEALRQYVEEFGIQAGINALFSNNTVDDRHLSPLAEAQCVRIVQEALTNVRKHAHARHVWVDMAADAGWLSIVIADDGIGLQGGTTARGHFGLQTMYERAQSVNGSFVIESALGQGTRVKLSLPLMS